MNLSCGKCRAIRTFSGNPPKCDVCGWVCETESTETTNRQNLRKQGQQPVSGDWEKRVFSKLFGWAIVISAILVVIYWLTPEQEKLANEYHISKQNVVVEPKPHGCDFDDAPLGNKHCHFEKNVDVERACSLPDCRVTAVYVSWHKVGD
jgi:hypothetical protein